MAEIDTMPEDVSSGTEKSIVEGSMTLGLGIDPAHQTGGHRGDCENSQDDGVRDSAKQERGRRTELAKDAEHTYVSQEELTAATSMELEAVLHEMHISVEMGQRVKPNEEVERAAATVQPETLATEPDGGSERNNSRERGNHNWETIWPEDRRTRKRLQKSLRPWETWATIPQLTGKTSKTWWRGSTEQAQPKKNAGMQSVQLAEHDDKVR
ncbi:hypothetical protein EG329_006594 [Mollisiaceae sp. DMI_Dod_QoI]|nr:hypothetical protein EG329_006594 [Helotiales sp. DMI_Dod_QoI]